MELSKESLRKAFDNRYVNGRMSEVQEIELLSHVILLSRTLSGLKGFKAAEVVALANDAYQLEVISQSK